MVPDETITNAIRLDKVIIDGIESLDLDASDVEMNNSYCKGIVISFNGNVYWTSHLPIKF